MCPTDQTSHAGGTREAREPRPRGDIRRRRRAAKGVGHTRTRALSSIERRHATTLHDAARRRRRRGERRASLDFDFETQKPTTGGATERRARVVMMSTMHALANDARARDT